MITAHLCSCILIYQTSILPSLDFKIHSGTFLTVIVEHDSQYLSYMSVITCLLYSISPHWGGGTSSSSASPLSSVGGSHCCPAPLLTQSQT